MNELWVWGSERREDESFKVDAVRSSWAEEVGAQWRQGPDLRCGSAIRTVQLRTGGRDRGLRGLFFFLGGAWWERSCV